MFTSYYLSRYSIPIWIPCHSLGMKLDLNFETVVGPLHSHHYFYHSPNPATPQLFCFQWFTQFFLIDNTQLCPSAETQSSLKIQLLYLLIPTAEIFTYWCQTSQNQSESCSLKSPQFLLHSSFPTTAPKHHSQKSCKWHTSKLKTY